jgi:hypothetical protein
MRFMYRPANPTPAGPSRMAAAFIFTIPANTFTTDDAPLIDEDRRIVR